MTITRNRETQDILYNDGSRIITLSYFFYFLDCKKFVQGNEPKQDRPCTDALRVTYKQSRMYCIKGVMAY